MPYIYFKPVRLTENCITLNKCMIVHTRIQNSHAMER